MSFIPLLVNARFNDGLPDSYHFISQSYDFPTLSAAIAGDNPFVGFAFRTGEYNTSIAYVNSSLRFGSYYASNPRSYEGRLFPLNGTNLTSPDSTSLPDNYDGDPVVFLTGTDTTLPYSPCCYTNYTFSLKKSVILPANTWWALGFSCVTGCNPSFDTPATFLSLAYQSYPYQNSSYAVTSAAGWFVYGSIISRTLLYPANQVLPLFDIYGSIIASPSMNATMSITPTITATSTQTLSSGASASNTATFTSSITISVSSSILLVPSQNTIINNSNSASTILIGASLGSFFAILFITIIYFLYKKRRKEIVIFFRTGNKPDGVTSVINKNPLPLFDSTNGKSIMSIQNTQPSSSSKISKMKI